MQLWRTWMRILLDESVPKDLRDHLPRHEVVTVQESGWQGKSDGELLRLAAPHFGVLITADQNLPHQQNLATFELGVVILVAQRNRLADYMPLLPLLREELTKVKPGKAIRVAL